MTKPIIALIGDPAWRGSVEKIAAHMAFDVTSHNNRDNYVNTLIDDHAALIIVDGTINGWPFWTATPKASPATRRIPIVLISDDSDIRQEALRTGADFAFPPDMLGTELEIVLRKHARLQDVATQKRLAAQCEDELPPRAQQAIQQFNDGQFYKQHDLLEEQWMEEEGPVRDLYRAILQVGVAYYQVQRNNRRGAYKMVLRSIQWLNVLPDTCQGVDVAQLRADAAALRDALEALPEDADLEAFDDSLLKPVKMKE